MTRQAISTGGAPAALGPYSQAIRSGDMVFCAGQLGIDPATGELADGVEAQTERALKNLASVLDAAGLSLRRRREDDLLPRRHQRLRGVQRASTSGSCRIRRRPARPSRSAALPLGGRVEIEAIARRARSTRSARPA